MTLQSVKFTRSDYERLPEGFPVELIHGQLVKEPSPTFGHQWIVGETYSRLRALVGPGRVVQSPIDVFVDEHNVLQPDVLVLSLPLGPKAKHATLPILVVEVLSPSTAHRDRDVKRQIYLDAGVEEVWIVDPETETIDIHTLAGLRSFGLDETAGSQAVPGFALTPRSVLRE